MKKNLYLLIGMVILYLVPSIVLQGIYGRSYGFLSGDDCWVADDLGGWIKHGNPVEPIPTEASVRVPLGVRYIPIFLPALLLILLYLTPLSRLIEPQPQAQKPDTPESTQEPPGD